VQDFDELSPTPDISQTGHGHGVIRKGEDSGRRFVVEHGAVCNTYFTPQIIVHKVCISARLVYTQDSGDESNNKIRHRMRHMN
jgi:hypothetical protein